MVCLRVFEHQKRSKKGSKEAQKEAETIAFPDLRARLGGRVFGTRAQRHLAAARRNWPVGCRDSLRPLEAADSL